MQKRLKNWKTCTWTKLTNKRDFFLFFCMDNLNLLPLCYIENVFVI